MDPIVIPALTTMISALVGGAAGEAGKSAWAALAALVRRRFAHDQDAVEAVERPGMTTPEDLARLLAERAASDPDFEAALSRWMSETKPVVRSDRIVMNSVHGDVSGMVVQAGDIHGSINFGGTP
jgi:hypothetical protein